jgi:hypothetical protein
VLVNDLFTFEKYIPINTAITRIAKTIKVSN